MKRFIIVGPPSGGVELDSDIDAAQLSDLILEEISHLSTNESSGWAGMFFIEGELGDRANLCADTGHMQWWLNKHCPINFEECN